MSRSCGEQISTFGMRPVTRASLLSTVLPCVLQKVVKRGSNSMCDAFRGTVFEFVVVYSVPCYFPTSRTFRIYNI